MNKLNITGASDDLIEIEDAIRDEFNWYPKDEEDKRYLAVNDGTLLEVKYDENGLWRFSLVAKGEAKFSKSEGSVTDDENDIVYLEWDKPFLWVVLATQKAVKGK